MTRESSVEKVDFEIVQGNLAKARDRLLGLIATYPNDLTLRTKLGDVYWKMELPAMAGRYWFLEENKTETMSAACVGFEKSCRGNPLNILRALRFCGSVEKLASDFAGRKLISLQEKCNEMYGFRPKFTYTRKPRWMPEIRAWLEKKQRPPVYARIIDRAFDLSVWKLLLYGLLALFFVVLFMVILVALELI